MEQKLRYAMDIGEQMLTSGAEIHRVEDAMERICHAFGAVRTDVFIITSSMVVTVSDQDEKIYTQTRRITTAETDYEKLHQMNQLCRSICEQDLTLDEVRREVKRISGCKPYPQWLKLICSAVIAGSFTLFFGGKTDEMLVSFSIGALVWLISYIAEKLIANKIFLKFVSAAAATYFAFLAMRWGIVPQADQVIIGNIMTLIPGIGLTNALRDLFTGDSIAGLLRSIEACLTALVIAGGYFFVVLLGGGALS